jgi:hypothetical protein
MKEYSSDIKINKISINYVDFKDQDLNLWLNSI